MRVTNKLMIKYKKGTITMAGMNYVSMWNFKKLGSIFSTEGDYKCESVAFFNDEDLDEVREVYEGCEEKDVTVGGWKIKLFYNEDEKTAAVCVNDTGMEEAEFNDETLKVVCEQNNIACIRTDVTDVVYEYAKNAPYDETECAAGIADLYPPFASILNFKAVDEDTLLIRDTAGNCHKHEEWIVAMIGTNIYDLANGYLGVNAYEYFEIQYGCNPGKNLMLIEGPTAFCPAVADELSDTEWEFWECLMKSEMHVNGRAVLKNVVNEITAE